LQKEQHWKWKYQANTIWFKWNLSEIWQYKDLLFRFARRDLVANYQQTILGPLWVLMQPILTMLVYWLVFTKIANISTNKIPPLLFYLPGIIVWSYYADCLNSTMNVFLQNASMFGKVYFPRLIVPLSGVLSHTVRMLVQLLLFVVIYVYYLNTTSGLSPTIHILLVPFLLLLTAAFSFGSGLIISVLTAKYRDLDYALQFLLRLFMFATPIVYPASLVPAKYEFIFWLNPLTALIETFRTVCFSSGEIQWNYLLICVAFVAVLLSIGITLFKKREQNIMDIL
jgi:lipopolysaccharide transport system permease protein